MGKTLMSVLDEMVKTLKKQLDALDAVIPKIDKHERELFNKCVDALTHNDEIWKARAILYANECAEVRKLLKRMLVSRYVIERVLLILEAVEDLQDLAVQGATVVQLLSISRKQLGGIVPEVSYYLGVVEEKLSKIIVEVEGSSGLILPFESKEVEKILKQAEEQVDIKLNERPKIPKEAM